VGEFDHMYEVELKNSFELKQRDRGVAGALQTWDIRDRESYKMRRGCVGGYLDYLEKSDIEYLNSVIQDTLFDSLGY